jgi:hypothetical protein
VKRRTRKHGLSYSPEYRAWQTMVHRCTSPRSPAWADYGGRGITVCDSWLDDPTQFYRDMGPKPSPAHELDRRDNNAGYSPENCRWVLRPENDRNRRSNRHITHAGETLTIAEWSERTGIQHTTITARLGMGWSPERALTAPVRPKAPKGQAKPTKHPCADCAKPVTGQRCHPCENRRRPSLRRAA